MEIIKNLDRHWFWLGYLVGVNSRKRISQSPNKIYNLGKQGVKKVPNTKQKISFFIGVYMGRGKIVQNFDVVKVIQYQDKNSHKSKGDYLSLELKSITTKEGATISLPFYICNNSVDNRGYIGYQAKFKYPTNYLTLNSITPSPTWTGSFQYQHDAGVVLVQGVNEAISYEDAVLGYLNFTVSDNVLNDQSRRFRIYVEGPSGRGTASDILTLINGDYYYIQPVNLVDSIIVVEYEGEEDPDTPTTPTEPTPPPWVVPDTLPPIADEDTPIYEDTDLIYDFDMTLNIIDTDGDGSTGANLIVKVTTGDGTTVYVSIPVQSGTHKYSGRLPLKLPKLSKGPIIIEMWVEPEDEDDIAYYFIKAGALWSFETTIPREEVNEVPIVEPKIKAYDNFRFIDKVHFEWEEIIVPDGPVISEIAVSDIMQFIDTFKGATSENDKDNKDDSFIINEIVHFEYDYIPPVEVEDMVVSESLLFVDEQEVGFVEVKKMGEEDALIIREIIKIEIEE